MITDVSPSSVIQLIATIAYGESIRFYTNSFIFTESTFVISQSYFLGFHEYVFMGLISSRTY